MKKKWIILIVLLAAFGFTWVYRIYRISQEKPVESIDKLQQQAGIPVRVFEVEKRNLRETVSLSGEIQAFREAEISPVLAERIENIHVQAGQQVKKGDLLVSLDATKSKLQVDQAKASLAQAQSVLTQLRNGSRPEEIAIAAAKVVEAESAVKLAKQEIDRQEGLYKEEATTLQLLEQAQNQYRNAHAILEAAKAQHELAKKGPREEEITQSEAQVQLAQVALNQAKEQLSDHFLTAPYDGVAGLRMVEEGSIVDFKQVIMKLAEVDRVYLVVDVSEIYILRLRPGDEVEFTVDALGTQRYQGKVADINPVTNAGTREYRTRIVVDNAEGKFRPGMFGRAEILVNEHKGALVVPADAVREEGTTKYVLKVDGDSTVQRVEVAVGKSYGNMVHVLSGVEPGDMVISLSQGSVEPGTKVTVSQRENGQGKNVEAVKAESQKG